MVVLLWGTEEQHSPSSRGILEFGMHLICREGSLLELEIDPQGYWEEDTKPWRTQEEFLAKAAVAIERGGQLVALEPVQGPIWKMSRGWKWEQVTRSEARKVWSSTN